MKTMKKTFMVGASGLLALTGAAGAAVAVEQPGDISGADVVAKDMSTSVNNVSAEHVHGEFVFTQVAIACNEYIQKNFPNAQKYLCGTHSSDEGKAEVSVQDWEIVVKGAVSKGYEATFGELADKEGSQSIVMGCSCAGNPADGLASVNAEVTGISATKLIEEAQPLPGANTVVFSSADGYEVALPLEYLSNRHSIIVFDVNGSPLAESVGGVNQLWLGSTAASYFARDIASITLEERQTPPPSPHSEEGRELAGNLPNVGILYGGDVA